MELPPDIPPEAVNFLQEIGYLQADRLRVGMTPPPLVLTSLEDGPPIKIGRPDTTLPTVLIFGSYT
jgi:hypothetical protein